MLGAGGDDVLAAPPIAICISTDGEVDGLSTTAGEHEVERIGRADELGHLLTGVLDGHACFPTLTMDAGRIPPHRRVVGHGGFKCFRQQRCCGIIVEVDASHYTSCVDMAVIDLTGSRPRAPSSHTVETSRASAAPASRRSARHNPLHLVWSSAQGQNGSRHAPARPQAP